jgi:2,4-dienoyl-CoA reductase-like NADH-dependent reductase (Old Yellow Enzyme family)
VVDIAAMSDAMFRPYRFRGGAISKNRLALAPLTNGQSQPDGNLADDELRWLERRAAGGFGVVTTCAAHVAADGKAWAGELGVDDDVRLPGLRRVASAISAHGALGMVQLFHGGLRASREVSGLPTWSASAHVEDAPGYEVPRAGTDDDVARVIAQFAAAARRCVEAGFAGVELHGAHGYLLSQFLSTTYNRRDDGWGGALAGRARLMREVTRAVRAAVPSDFVVGVRLSPEDFGQARGLDLGENLELARWLCDDGVDFLHLSLWKALDHTRTRPEAHALDLFRAVVPADVALFVAGSVWTPAEAAGLLDRGADFIALGRAAILNPDWPLHAATAGWEPARPPMTAAALGALDVSPTFVGYLRKFKNLVAD